MPEELSNAAIRLDIQCYFQKIKIEKKNPTKKFSTSIIHYCTQNKKRKKKLNRNKANQFVVFC